MCSMNVTLSIDDRIVERARERAAALGKSLNQAVRDYLAQLGGEGDVEDSIREMRELSAKGGGNRRGWKFDREELHERT